MLSRCINTEEMAEMAIDYQEVTSPFVPIGECAIGVIVIKPICVDLTK